MWKWYVMCKWVRCEYFRESVLYSIVKSGRSLFEMQVDRHPIDFTWMDATSLKHISRNRVRCCNSNEYSKGSLSKAGPTKSTGSMRRRGSRWRKPNIAFPHRYVLIKDPPALDPHFSPRIRRHSHPFSSRLYFEGWILMLRYPRVISSRCTSIRVAFSSSYALSLCALFAALYLNFRACVGRTSDDSTGMLIVPLLLVPFFPRLYFHGKLSESTFVSRMLLRHLVANIPLSHISITTNGRKREKINLYPGKVNYW